MFRTSLKNSEYCFNKLTQRQQYKFRVRRAYKGTYLGVDQCSGCFRWNKRSGEERSHYDPPEKINNCRFIVKSFCSMDTCIIEVSPCFYSLKWNSVSNHFLVNDIVSIERINNRVDEPCWHHDWKRVQLRRLHRLQWEWKLWDHSERKIDSMDAEHTNRRCYA